MSSGGVFGSGEADYCRNAVVLPVLLDAGARSIESAAESSDLSLVIDKADTGY
jgi:hypothetical protein